MSDHILKIDLEDEIYSILNSGITEEIEFTPEEMEEIAEKAKEYIWDDDSLWNAFDNCVSDAIIYVRHRRNKIDEQY